MRTEMIARSPPLPQAGLLVCADAGPDRAVRRYNVGVRAALLIAFLLSMPCGGTIGALARAEPPAPPAARIAAQERDMARVEALAAERTAWFETELGMLVRRLSALRLGKARLAYENTRLNREALDADRRLRRLVRDAEVQRDASQDLRTRLGASEARADRLQARIAELEERLASKRPDPEAIAAGRARVAELHKAYRTLLAARPQDPTRKAALASTASALQRAQIELALLTGARGVYTVQEGDSLGSIARFFYRDPARWPAIFEANAIVLDRPEGIAPGNVLLIPP